MLGSAWRAVRIISIHALREEGDSVNHTPGPAAGVFLSTPSARRATTAWLLICAAGLFLSTPSARRATHAVRNPGERISISIHALREEGDPPARAANITVKQFLSTPSARRATDPLSNADRVLNISIHALREEGDGMPCRPPCAMSISIHALREEGDCWLGSVQNQGTYFYPRPPRGGRRTWFLPVSTPKVFLSTPSARRATASTMTVSVNDEISIHALREEGDR